MSENPADHVTGPDIIPAAADGRTAGASLSPLAQQYLDQTRPWVKFMSVVTFIGAGLTMVLGLVVLVISMFSGAAAANQEAPGLLGSAVGGGLLALLYLAMACVYIAPGLYLFRYAGAIGRLKVNPTAGVLEDALKHQKSFWRFVGILSVVGLALAVVVLGLAVVAGVIGALMAGRS